MTAYFSHAQNTIFFRQQCGAVQFLICPRISGNCLFAIFFSKFLPSSFFCRCFQFLQATWNFTPCNLCELEDRYVFRFIPKTLDNCMQMMLQKFLCGGPQLNVTQLTPPPNQKPQDPGLFLGSLLEFFGGVEFFLDRPGLQKTILGASENIKVQPFVSCVNWYTAG